MSAPRISVVVPSHAVAAGHPGAIVQGRTTVGPDELAVQLRAPNARSQEVEPPSDWAQTCNVLYPRAVLEAAGGFREVLPLATPAGREKAITRFRGIPHSALRARPLG